MSYTKIVNTFPSTNGKNDITYYVYKPEGEIRGILQISHGMCEYVERYEPHIEFFTANGLLVCGNDHLGHKNSVTNKGELGYMGAKDGWKNLYEDVHKMTTIIKEQYPGLPVVLFGHSMGSFVARATIANYGNEYAAAIICGTAGSNPIAKLGLGIAKFVRLIRGKYARSAMLTALSFGNYNSKYENPQTAYEWLTRDQEVVKKYMNDEYCMFTFTTSGYVDLISILSYVSSDAWYDMVPDTLPIFLISGDMDPVGNWGEGVKEVASKLQKKKRADFSMKLYPQMHHEILNEFGKEEVYSDMLEFINRVL